jgi:glycosyltransferase involved in cell wall biosynthesis
MDALPVSAVVATRERAGSLLRTLDSLLSQRILPDELIVVDGSADDESKSVLEAWSRQIGTSCTVRWRRATKIGAAVQRNQGVALATQPFIWFFDDDITFEPDCVERLWHAMKSDTKLGGVNAMIVNQRYQPPGAVSRMMFNLMHERLEKSFAGRVIGPAVNLLPEDRDDMPEIVPVEWLNTTCTIYRREALPSPPFDAVFTGYSLMEDLTLSLRVAKKWRLANARTARIFHDSQPGAQKADVKAMAKMELINRHYVVTEILGRKRFVDLFRLALWEGFQFVVAGISPQSRRNILAVWCGKQQAIREIRSRGKV